MQTNLKLSEIDEDYRISDDFKTVGEEEDVKGELCHKCFNEDPYVKACRRCHKTGFLKSIVTMLLAALILSSCNTSKKSASGGTVILQGKNHLLTLGNPRIRKHNKKAPAKIGASEYDNKKQ